MSTRRRRTTRIDVSLDRGVFMISVAAELADMHPQTLRMYEARGLIEPQRSPKGTRLYSQADVERLRRIQEMTAELGLNLAGVERVLSLEQQLERSRRKVELLERQLAEARRETEDARWGSIRPRASYMRSVCGCMSASSCRTGAARSSPCAGRARTAAGRSGSGATAACRNGIRGERVPGCIIAPLP
jgi:DNA-binding transcriptional MerR regulator